MSGSASTPPDRGRFRASHGRERYWLGPDKRRDNRRGEDWTIERWDGKVPPKRTSIFYWLSNLQFLISIYLFSSSQNQKLTRSLIDFWGGARHRGSTDPFSPPGRFFLILLPFLTPCYIWTKARSSCADCISPLAASFSIFIVHIRLQEPRSIDSKSQDLLVCVFVCRRPRVVINVFPTSKGQ